MSPTLPLYLPPFFTRSHFERSVYVAGLAHWINLGRNEEEEEEAEEKKTQKSVSCANEKHKQKFMCVACVIVYAKRCVVCVRVAY